MNPGNARADPGGDYDLLPYPSLPFAYTQPAHLAAMAALYGCAAPPADRARVLELGCASGGNIVPLAARFPDARFLGIDLSRRHVEAGRRRVATLRLENIEIRQADLAETRLRGEAFDYVICHGVYSWVPAATQDTILRLCAETLAPDGLAVVSYNVLPGWHLRSIVRDICLGHVGSIGTPRERVAAARDVLAKIADMASEAEPYGMLLRREADRIAQLPASYILGEFLVADNHPCHFRDFVGRVEAHGLGYLCEGDLAGSISEQLFPEAGRRLRELAGDDRVALEQYKDFLSGRPFRRSVLTRAGRAMAAPQPTRLRALHVASRLRRDAEQGTAEQSVFKDARGRAVRAADPVVRGALQRLADAWPATCHVSELVEDAARQHSRNNVEQRVCGALFALVAAGQATVSTLPLHVGNTAAPHPRVWPLASLEAAEGQPWVTGMHHDAVPLDTAGAVLIAHMDGKNDRSALKKRLAEALQRGAARPPEARAAADAHALADRLFDDSLRHIADSALIEP